MKLTSKIVTIIFLGVLIAFSVDAYLDIKWTEELITKDLKRDTLILGTTLASAVSQAWRSAGESGARKLIDEIDQSEQLFRIRLVELSRPLVDDSRIALTPEILKAVIQGKPISTIRNRHGDNNLLYTYIPILVDSETKCAIEIVEQLSLSQEYRQSIIVRRVVLFVVTAALCILVVIIVGVRFVARPLEKLIQKTKRIGTGDLSEPVSIAGNDELSKIGDAINQMCDGILAAQEKARTETEERIATIKQLRHADRLASVGKLAAGVAHELGTPLNVVLARASLISSGKLAPEKILENAGIIQDQSTRITNIIRQMLDFARRDTSERGLSDLCQIIKDTVRLLSPGTIKQNVNLRLFGGDDISITVSVNAEQLRQVLMNIIINAVEAMPDGGDVQIGVESKHVNLSLGHDGIKGNAACISIRDQGEGIPKKNLPNIFDPFFTTKDIGEGTGLGLSVVHGIIDEHGGWIEVTSEVGKGSCFTIYLPQAEIS